MRERIEAILDMGQVVIVAARGRIGSNLFFAVHRQGYKTAYTEMETRDCSEEIAARNPGRMDSGLDASHRPGMRAPKSARRANHPKTCPALLQKYFALPIGRH